jgi:hypothetical protein
MCGQTSRSLHVSVCSEPTANTSGHVMILLLLGPRHSQALGWNGRDIVVGP